MIKVGLRERQRLTYVAGIGLAQGVVPALHVRGLSALFAHTVRGGGREDRAVGVPELPTRLFTAVANDKGHDLPGAPTHGSPQPALVLPARHERPDLVQLQFIPGLSGQQSILDAFALRRFFLTMRPGSAAPLQRPAQSPAYWAVHSRRPGCGLGLHRCRARSDSRRHSCRTLYTDTVACLWRCARSLPGRGSDNEDICE